MKCVLCLALVAMFPVLAAPASAQATDSEKESEKYATELAKRLGDQAASSFAAAVPENPSRFVAALHIPNVQLLVIAGNYAAPALLRESLLKADYRRVYLDLNSAAEREGRFFVEDLGANGLRADREPNGPFDITWRDGTERTLYNGDWKAQELSPAEYRARFEKDAAEYTGMLKLLLDAHVARATAQGGS